jgi:hypothetical protein
VLGLRQCGTTCGSWKERVLRLRAWLGGSVAACSGHDLSCATIAAPILRFRWLRAGGVGEAVDCVPEIGKSEEQVLYASNLKHP